MIYFSEKNQSFYDTEIHGENIPTGSIEITSDQHIFLLTALNTGCIIFADLTTSLPRPDKFHTWDGKDWVDMRTDDEKRAFYLASLRPLTRRQFKLALIENGLLDQIENSISAIEDDQTRARIQIEYTEATEFHRTSDSVAYMCQLLVLTDEQVDQMWEHALTL